MTRHEHDVPLISPAAAEATASPPSAVCALKSATVNSIGPGEHQSERAILYRSFLASPRWHQFATHPLRQYRVEVTAGVRCIGDCTLARLIDAHRWKKLSFAGWPLLSGPELRRNRSNLLLRQLRHGSDDTLFGDAVPILRDTNIPIERTADCIRSARYSYQARLRKLQRRTWRRKIKTVEPVYADANDDRTGIGRAPLLKLPAEKTGLSAPGLFRLCAHNRRQQ